MSRFAEAALSALARSASASPVAVLAAEVLRFREDGTLQKRVVAQPLWPQLVSKCASAIQRLPQTEELTAELIRADALVLPLLSTDSGTPIRPSPDDIRRLVWEKLRILLVSYLARVQRPSFDNAVFSEHLVRYWEVWHSQHAQHTVHIPLVGVVGDAMTIELDDNLRICPLPPDTKTEFWNGPCRGCWGVDERELAACGFQVEGSYLGPPDHSDNRINSAADIVVLAMRLRQAGTVVPMGSYEEIARSEFHTSSGASVAAHWRPIPRERDPYRLSSDTADGLRALYLDLFRFLSTPWSRNLAVCLRRFGQTYVRDNPEDKIIDLSIALESALLPAQRDELKYRMAVRGAALLKRRRHPKETYRLLRLLYDLRSRIVHEGKSLASLVKEGRVDEWPESTFVLAAQDVVRQVILELVTTMTPERGILQIMEALDDELIARLDEAAS